MMHVSVIHVLLTLVAGVLTGVMSASFGIGGATISTPAIRALGVTALFAIGTTLPSILPSAVSGTARYVRAGLVDWRVVRLTVPVGVAGSIGGSLLSHVVPGDGHWLMIITAGILGFTAWRMAHGSEPGMVEPHGRRRDNALTLGAVGAAAGVLSGLLGVGGGVIMVPGFTELARIPLKTTIATSLVCVGAFAIPGTITHAGLGDIDWLTAGLLSVGVIPGARLGAALAIRTKDRRLRLAVSIFLGAVSVIYAVGEIAALRR